MSGIQAARVSAKAREELGVEVELVEGGYGELTVLVDDEAIVRAGTLRWFGVLPSMGKVLKRLRERLGR